MWMGYSTRRLMGSFSFCRWDKYINPCSWRDAAHLSELSCGNTLWGVLLLVDKCWHGQKQLEAGERGRKALKAQWILFSIAASPFAICPGSLGIPVIPCLSVQFQTVWGSTITTPAELRLQMKNSSCLMALLCHEDSGMGSEVWAPFCLHRYQFGKLTREWQAIGKIKQINSNTFQTKNCKKKCLAFLYSVLAFSGNSVMIRHFEKLFIFVWMICLGNQGHEITPCVYTYIYACGRCLPSIQQ